MSQVRFTPKSPKKWFVLLGMVAVTVGAWLWWFGGEEAAQVVEQVSAAPSQVSATKSPTTGGEMLLTSTTPTAQEMAAIRAQTVVMVAKQNEAAKEIERQPALKPIKGRVSARPSFLSEMEWQMLNGVAQQHATPDQELTRLVNFVRFTKQLELWQSLGNSGDMAKRKTLADELLADLPSRLVHGEMDLKEAQRTQATLLNDAVSDPAQRHQRAAKEAKRLVVVAQSSD